MVDEFVNFKGKIILSSEMLFDGQNRAFRYGDGFFETIRASQGRPLWMDYHMSRIRRSAGLLKMKLPAELGIRGLTVAIERLLELNNHKGGARVRLSVYRDGYGFYKPVSDHAAFLIESSELASAHYQLNKAGLLIGVYPDAFKPINFLSGMKTSNALLYIMAGIYANEKGWDDALILNESELIAEATSSNIFVVDEGTIYTPAADQGGVEGVMRNVIMTLACKAGFKLNECALKPQDLLQVDEVFITNTVKGIEWVKGFRSKRYFHNVAGKLIDLLNDAKGEF